SSTDSRHDGNNLPDYVTRRFNAFSAGRKRPVWLELRWDRRLTRSPVSTWSPESAEARSLLGRTVVEAGSWFHLGTGLQLKQSTIQPQQKNENKKYANSTLKKINRRVAFAARFSSHPAHVSPLWPCAGESSG